MHWNLWLAKLETQRSLAAALRITGAVVVLWTLAAAYGVWSTRAALAAAQLSVVAQSNQMSQIVRALPEKRREARKAAEVQLISSPSAGSAEITEELADIARVAGAEIRGVRVGDDGQPVVAARTAATPSPAAQAPAADSDGSRETFECNIAGEYPALMRFLSGLAASNHVLDITSLQVTPGDAKARPDAPQLEMKIAGTVYEASAKP